MQFFKKMLGIEKDLSERIDKFKAKGTLFEVVKDTRNVKLKESNISFQEIQPEKYTINFKGEKEEIYQLPVHLNMNAVTFSINKAGKPLACFEWQLEDETQHVGCYMDVENRQQFRQILCLILKNTAKDDHIKDHLSFCKQLSGIPVYKTHKETNTNVSSSIASKLREQLNDILIAEAQKKDNKMVHSCSIYHVQNNQRTLIQQPVVFVLKAFPNFTYEFQVVNASGHAFLKKVVDTGLNYEINIDRGYIRWIDIDNDCRIIQVNFEGKRDVALSLKYNMLEVMYELREKRKIEQDVSSQELAYMKKMSDEEPKQEKSRNKIVQIYQQKEQIQQISDKNFLYQDQDLKGGIKYDNLCQAKINNFSIAALGSLMQTLSIGEDSHIKQSDKRRLFDREGKQVQIGEILLHDSDSKSFIRGHNGKLYYQDIVKGKLVQQFNPSPKKGIVNICPQFKLADASDFKTFKAISQNAIYEIDPRTKEGVGSLKDYSTNPQFSTLSATGNGSFVTGAQNGQIRFYKTIGKNANNKFTSAGDPVIHLDTTKDGKWVLATFRRYLRLIPTQNDDDISLFDKKIPFNERPTPIKLQITLQDLQRYNIRDFTFLPAKFDQSKVGVQKFIISGFGQYTVIWNLGKTIKGDRTYIISKSEGKVIQADFRYNDPTKLVMTTTQGIVVKQNKFRK